MTMTILQVTGKLKSNGKKQTVIVLAIEGSGEFFYFFINNQYHIKATTTFQDAHLPTKSSNDSPSYNLTHFH